MVGAGYVAEVGHVLFGNGGVSLLGASVDQE